METRSRFVTWLRALSASLALSTFAGAANRLFVDDATLSVGQTGAHIPVHCENDVDVLGLSVAIEFDSAVLDVTEVVPGAAVPEDAWFEGRIFDGRLKYGLIFDLEIVNILPPATDTTVVELVVDVVGGPTTTTIAFHDVEANAEYNVLTDSDGKTMTGASFEDGTITISDAPPPAVFKRGDSNANGKVDLSDAVNTLNWLFLGEEDPVCLDAVDTTDDGKTDLTDAVAVLNYLFRGQAAPKAPGPLECGEDPTDEDDLVDCAYPAESCEN